MRDLINIVETQLNEAGAGTARIVQRIREGTPFFMISACRANLTPEINKKRTKILKDKLAALPGVSFLEMEGHYQEKDWPEPSIEASFFVMPRSANTNTTKFLIVGEKLGKAFEQDSILTGDGEKVELRFADGETMPMGNVATFSASNLEQMDGKSKFGNTQFAFTTADNAPGGTEYGSARAVA